MKISELMLDPKFDLDKYIEDLKKENQQLKHNRDKAIDYIEEKFFDGMYKYQLLNILKGDSDGNIR